MEFVQEFGLCTGLKLRSLSPCTARLSISPCWHILSRFALGWGGPGQGHTPGPNLYVLDPWRGKCGTVAHKRLKTGNMEKWGHCVRGLRPICMYKNGLRLRSPKRRSFFSMMDYLFLVLCNLHGIGSMLTPRMVRKCDVLQHFLI
jgi:hypothetical protein